MVNKAFYIILFMVISLMELYYGGVELCTPYYTMFDYILMPYNILGALENIFIGLSFLLLAVLIKELTKQESTTI